MNPGLFGMPDGLPVSFGRPLLRTILASGSGIYTKLDANNIVLAYLQGAGGGGGGGAGGGAGAFAIGLCIDNVVSHPWLVGAPGAGSAATGANGGLSRFESFLAEGGFGGSVGSGGSGGTGGFQFLDTAYLQAGLLYAISGGKGGTKNVTPEPGWAPGWSLSQSNTANPLSAGYLGRLGNGRGLAGAIGSGGGDSVLGAGGTGGGATGGAGGVGAGGGGGTTGGNGGSGRIIVFEFSGALS